MRITLHPEGIRTARRELRRPTTARHEAGRFGGESGFTMIVTLVVMFIASLLMAGAFAAANGDIHLTHTDTSAKKAYYAAQAGISDYIYHLNQDINYWTYCTAGLAATNHSLNQEGSIENKVPVPGVSDEEYAIQLLPATTAPSTDKKCDPAKPVETMIESGKFASGSFRINSTGFSGNQERTITATFAHRGFLEYIYYTKYETLDPVTYTPVQNSCAAFLSSRPASCTTIQFITADKVNGPIHSEDTVSICGEPIFGRGPSDKVEFRGGSTAAGGGCSNSAQYLGTLIAPANVASLEPPPSNNSLLTDVEPAYHYEGKTTLVLEGEKMKVTYIEGEGGSAREVVKENVPFPANGLIYVSNKTCSVTYTPYNPTYSEDTGCGNVYVKGNYSGQLTIAAENDIVINGNITTAVNGEGVPMTNAVLGLIANNFVRVYHPLSGRTSHTAFTCNSASNAAGTMANPTIYAAILAVNHSFIVDNYDCGAPQEKLTVYGAIAQIFRGTVGTHSGGEVVSGYSKNYIYDDRLKIESPPHFLNPVKAAWLIRRETVSPNP
jgi:type II secretory pathway pseudopilin PulG